MGNETIKIPEACQNEQLPGFLFCVSMAVVGKIPIKFLFD